MADELSAPLKGKKQNRKTDRPRVDIRQWPLARTLFGILAIISIVVIGRILLVNDPEGGRPVASVSISTIEGGNEVASRITTEPISATPSVVSEQTIAGNNGMSITTIGDDVPDSSHGTSVGVAALTEFGVMPELIEETQNGPIPRISIQGDTPFNAYARASITPDAAAGKPLIAVIITGMGLSEGGTLDAIEKLPDNITLAFAPYGRSLQRTAGAARAGGHELMLEIPLEPFDYPENDPGPQTLLTGQPPRANLDRLFWLLARLGGYTALINHMGARFTASAADFGPIIEELGTRGLGYVDDGSSNRSIAANLTRNNRVPFGRADIQLDKTPARAAILTALENLEKRANDNGTAVGIASALPVSIQTIADWARGLEERGILLVPVSALMTKP